MTPELSYLLIGLGNPGREYQNNRHNFGFMLIDRIAVRLNARGLKVQSKAIVTICHLRRSQTDPCQTADVYEPVWSI